MADDIQEKLLHQQNQVLKQSVNSIYSDLVSHPIKNRIPEQVFVQGFLPFFSGKAPDQSRNYLGEWIGIAGNATAEVDVVNERGEVIYSVPAMVNSNMLDVSKRRAGDSVQEMVGNYKLRESHFPGSGNNYLNKAVDDKVQQMVQGQLPISQTEQRWIDIMQRYDIAPPAGMSTTQQVQASANDSGVDDLDYS